MPGLEAPARRVAAVPYRYHRRKFQLQRRRAFRCGRKMGHRSNYRAYDKHANTRTGPVGTIVTISGLNFGATQGTSTLTFNSAAASPTSWSDKNIVVAVPALALHRSG